MAGVCTRLRVVFILFSGFYGIPSHVVFSQSPSPGAASDSVQATALHWSVTAGSVGTIASRNHQPLWLTANRYGTLADEGADLSTFAGGNLTWNLPRHWVIGTGVRGYLNQGFSHAFLEQAFARIAYRKWQLQAGRFEQVSGEVNPSLSSGSFGISGNALPIPKISLSTSDYVSIPFTHNWVQFRGRLSHGWLGGQQYVRNALLHEKSLYLKVGRDKWNLYGGASHFAQWGGTHPDGPLPQGIKDFARVLLGKSGDNGVATSGSSELDRANFAGNHLIIFDFGGEIRIGNSRLRAYTQSIFEHGSAADATTRDRARGFKLFSPDRLAGLTLSLPEKFIIRNVLLELVKTDYQGGSTMFVGMDNYYNHAIYRTGWVYQGQIIGTPLFITQDRARKYQLSPQATGDQHIVSNRIVGAHFGLKGQLSERISWRTLATTMRHYGNYYNETTFGKPRNQQHLLQEFTVKLPKGFTGTAALGYDFGDLSTNLGGLLGVQWTVGK